MWAHKGDHMGPNPLIINRFALKVILNRLLLPLHVCINSCDTRSSSQIRG